MAETPRARHPRDVARSEAFRDTMNWVHPTSDPTGWSISDTGTVWTEVVASPGTVRERRAQVVAFTSDYVLLVIPLLGEWFACSVEDFATLAGAETYWKGRSNA
jgi:hypothetical protein